MFSPETTNEKFQKNLKKVVDKEKTACYNNQAVADKAGRGCTLKIEQCKNSLCKIGTRKRVLKVRNDYKDFFESYEKLQ